ncbi:MAG: nucleotidyltransferase domain-containing protein [Lachnospiraceae bacterium]|nr:nucleotidyltransferase domain-containing protein [Lachnospiraceae bacterium]
MNSLLMSYVRSIKEIYGDHVNRIILYGSYARGDYREDSDVDIMILLDISDIDIKKYRHQLSDMTFDFNMDNDMDIKPIAKSKEDFLHWLQAYPFYKNIDKEGVVLYAA